MPTSPVFDLPYPGPGDPNNVPVDLYALVQRLEQLLPSSGTYTPVFSDQTEDFQATGPFNWYRVGDVVTVSGRLNADTTESIFCSALMTLPVASNLTSAADLTGLLRDYRADMLASGGGRVTADASTDKALISWWPASDGPNLSAEVILHYKVNA